MTNEQIFEKAIRIYFKNDGIDVKDYPNLFNYSEDFFINCEYYNVIFNRHFAKAFWGEEEATWCEVCGNCKEMDCWQYHLQEMVLEKEPLKYIERFL